MDLHIQLARVRIAFLAIKRACHRVPTPSNLSNLLAMKNMRNVPSSASIGSLNKNSLLPMRRLTIRPRTKTRHPPIFLLLQPCTHARPSLRGQCTTHRPNLRKHYIAFLCHLHGYRGWDGVACCCAECVKVEHECVDFGAFGVALVSVKGEERSRLRGVVLSRWRSFRRYGWFARKSGETMSIMASL
jgi:hypothetical protein